MFRVLAAVGDDLDQAASQATFIASIPGSSEVDVHVAHADDDTDERGPNGEPLPPEESNAVQTVRDRLTSKGYAVETHETYLPVAEGIVDLATDIEADLVVIGARDRTPVGKAVFGSVTQSVVLDSPVPVAVVGVE